LAIDQRVLTPASHAMMLLLMKPHGIKMETLEEAHELTLICISIEVK
jgi:hypothetical protein